MLLLNTTYFKKEISKKKKWNHACFNGFKTPMTQGLLNATPNDTLAKRPVPVEFLKAKWSEITPLKKHVPARTIKCWITNLKRITILRLQFIWFAINWR
jgi:hypothetical protein